MRLLANLICFVVLVSAYSPAVADNEIEAKKISDRVIMVSLEGFATQTAILTEKGIVVVDNVWSARSAKRYRAAIEREFGRSDFIYVVNLLDDLINVGGNCAYPEAQIIAQQDMAALLKERKNNLAELVEERGKVFDVKVKQSEERMAELDPTSEDWKGWKRWRDTCKLLASELRDDYVLAEPTMTFADRLNLDLGDITLDISYFGACDSTGSTIIHVPEESLVLSGSALHAGHLSPTQRELPGGFDVPRWIEVLERIRTSTGGVNLAINSYSGIMDGAQFERRGSYIESMWESVNAAIENGTDFETAKDLLSLDAAYAHVKDWAIYKRDADWATAEHERTLKVFWREARKRSDAERCRE